MDAQPAGARPVPQRLVMLAGVFYGALFAAAAAWRWLADGAWPWRVAPEDPSWPLLLRVLAGVALGAFLIAASRIWTRYSAAGRALADELGSLLSGITTPQALLLAALSGLAEEAFFRGALQPRVGWLAASLLFGLAHFHPRRALRVWSLSAALAGLGFGALFAASGDLVAPAIAHVVVNAANLRWLARDGAPSRRG